MCSLYNSYFKTMLSAHFATVATLVPTDVDAHIRHHIWQEIETDEDLDSALDIVDEVAGWDARPVSARVVELGRENDGRCLAGHQGEWLSVRAGALGRALWMNASEQVERIRESIDKELLFEVEAFREARARKDAWLALRCATTLAHNLGDLSRVVEAFGKGTPHRDEMVEHYASLGHTTNFGANLDLRREFALAGHLNKAVMAHENHRFLPLREARGLRQKRAFIVPLGPLFYDWGKTVGSDRTLEENEQADVLSALLHGHEQAPHLIGYPRAIAGFHDGYAGGIERLEKKVPARLRKFIAKGAVRDALRLPEERILQRLELSYKKALEEWPGK